MLKKIYIETTNICNLKCKFCPETNRKKEFMSMESFEEIIKKVHKHTKLVCLHVKGEPLLHPELDKLLKIIEKYNLKANITTNGTLINEKLEILKNSKVVRQINFSIHSITQNKTLDKEYLKSIFNSVEQLNNKIVSYRLWNITELQQNEVNEEIIEWMQSYYNIENLAEILKYNSFYKIRENLFINQDIEFTWPNINGKDIIQKGRCLALKEQIAILVDGTVVPCCLDNNGDIPLGNILEEGLQDILNNDKSKNIKNNFANNFITCKLCKTCGFLKRLEEKRLIK